MEDAIWRFGVVANIKEYHIGEDGKTFRGTKAFTAGTKVYLDGKYWNKKIADISVIGRNRFGRTVLECIPIDCLENVRAQRIFKPRVLEIIDYLEKIEGCDWWGKNSADRKDTQRFVKEWNSAT